jgi:hypothetical protein
LLVTLYITELIGAPGPYLCQLLWVLTPMILNLRTCWDEFCGYPKSCTAQESYGKMMPYIFHI